MNLLKLVKILNSDSDIEKIISKKYPDLEIDYADIYFENEISIDSNLVFFNAEELSGKMEFKLDGIEYIRELCTTSVKSKK